MKYGRLFVTSLLVLGSGCAGPQLMPTPNVYRGLEEEQVYPDVLASQRVAEADLFYVTDRAPQETSDGSVEYGSGRSRSFGYGSTTVSMGAGLSWAELSDVSRAEARTDDLELRIEEVRELGRFPENPMPATFMDGRWVVTPEASEEFAGVAHGFKTELRRRLEEAPRKEVVIFIHGFNLSFHDGAQTMAGLWHFLGRQHVPLLYSWPAGSGGPTAYIYDRESSEFTVFHLKQVLRLLGNTPEVERVHIVAHSRGTDTVLSAIRELMIQAYAAGLNPLEHYRIANLILAAPDIDMEVLLQRVMSERFNTGVGTVTVYTSQSDAAIGAAEAFFGSETRLGRLTAEDLSEQSRNQLSASSNVAIIEVVDPDGDSVDHVYFIEDAAASSDLILVIRDGDPPGQGKRSALQFVQPGFWKLLRDYPNAESEE